MKWELFETIRDGVENKNTDEVLAQLKELQTEVQIINNNKKDAIEDIKKLKSFKHNILEKFEMEKDISLDDSLSAIENKMGDFKTRIKSIDTLKESNDGKLSELNELRNIVASTQSDMKDMKDKLESEKMENKMNSIKSEYRKHLTDNGITSVKAQELAIKSSISELKNIEDIQEYAKTFAESNSFLTDTQHVKGTDTTPSKNQNVKTSLKDCATKEERIAFHSSQMEQD